jgi:hypothetical protein
MNSSVEFINTTLVILRLKLTYHEGFMLNQHSLNINLSPIQHWVPPRMPPRFSFIIGLTSSVNAP